MGKIEKITVYRYTYTDEKVIKRTAELVVTDEGDEFREINRIEIDLDNDLDNINQEELKQKLEEAKEWVCLSRKRLEKAKMLSEYLNVPLEIEDC